MRDADVPPTWVAWSLDRGPAFERDTRCSIEHRPSRGERRQPRLDEWVLFYTADERHQAMRQWAHGDHHTEAGVELLITHGVWPERLDSAGFLS